MANWIENVFVQILNMSMTAGYCIIAVLLIRVIFRKAPRKYLYTLWLVVAFRLICPVSLSTDFSLFNVGMLLHSAPAEKVGAMEYIALSEEGEVFEGINTGNVTANVFVNQQLPHAVHTVTGYSMEKLLHAVFPYLTYVWAAGVLVFLGYYVVSVWRLQRNVRLAVLVQQEDKPEWPERRPIKVYECDELASPFAMGIFHPRIYLPYHLEEERRQMILLHEQYHIHRKDHLVKLLAFFLLAVYWFHPLVWAAWFGMCRDMEMSCDEKVLELLGEEHKKEYSMTLLAFAIEGRPENRMPLGFGEHDVKSRIRHALNFQKPTVCVGVLAVALLVVVLLVFGTNGKGNELSEAEDRMESEYSEEALLLYESRNPYVGDISADGEVIKAIRQCLPEFSEITAYKTELQTSREPYQFHFILEEAAEDSPKLDAELEAALTERMVPGATLMLALIDNLGEVAWSHWVEQGISEAYASVIWNLEQAESYYGVESLKEYGDSPERVQELLDILEEKPAPTNVDMFGRDLPITDTDAPTEVFMEWYNELPGEVEGIYGNALPYEEQPAADYQRAIAPFMVVLGQTEDGIVTVYGCYSKAYGSRGITIDYRITPDGDSNTNELDLRWNISNPCCQVQMADYDRDGRDEIALVLLGGSGTGIHQERLVIFETYETGRVEPLEFTPERQEAEKDVLVAEAIDTQNKQVHLLDQSSPESSVPLLSLSYGELEVAGSGAATGIEMESIVRFRLLNTGIFMYARAGIVLENWAASHVQEGEDAAIMFRVYYDYSPNLYSGYFSMAEPRAVSGF